jgi:protein tyrosine phosphatase
MRILAEEASTVLKSKTASVAVNCLSGRGRTGTFSAIILGKLLAVTSHSGLVDIIVSMREHRDGLVETPAQFRWDSFLIMMSALKND